MNKDVIEKLEKVRNLSSIIKICDEFETELSKYEPESVQPCWDYPGYFVDYRISSVNDIGSILLRLGSYKNDVFNLDVQIADNLFNRGYQKLHIEKYEEKWVISFETREIK